MKTKILFPILLIGLAVFANPVKAQVEKIQTAFVLQLTRLVEWCPMGKQGNFTIGVLCDNPKILSELNSLQGKKVINQTIEVKKLSSVSEVKSVNIVFVSRDKISDLQSIIAAIGVNCTLIIADKPGAAGQGAAISFIEDNGRIHFEINASYAEKHSLRINNELVKLAKRVF